MEPHSDGAMPSTLKTKRISSQAVGAYGEKVVEAELLRSGWITSNVNTSIKNAVDFDLYALKNDLSIQVRVKTCGPGTDAFQFGFHRSQDVVGRKFSGADFTVLVRMGNTRQENNFYVMPTGIVREAIVAWKNAYLQQAKRDGLPRKDTGHWTLHLREMRSGEDRLSHGFARKWATYLDNWQILDRKKLPPKT